MTAANRGDDDPLARRSCRTQNVPKLTNRIPPDTGGHLPAVDHAGLPALDAQPVHGVVQVRIATLFSVGAVADRCRTILGAAPGGDAGVETSAAGEGVGVGQIPEEFMGHGRALPAPVRTEAGLEPLGGHVQWQGGYDEVVIALIGVARISQVVPQPFHRLCADNLGVQPLQPFGVPIHDQDLFREVLQVCVGGGKGPLAEKSGSKDPHPVDIRKIEWLLGWIHKRYEKGLDPHTGKLAHWQTGPLAHRQTVYKVWV